jgi:hypothetical protein
MRARTPGDRPVVVIPIWLDWLLERSYRGLQRLDRAVGAGPTTGRVSQGDGGALAVQVGATSRRPGSAVIGAIRAKDAPGISPPRGFHLYQQHEPKAFNLSVFSFDATLPVINLHAYDAYFPQVFGVQLISFLQHVLGWWIATSLLASLAVL